MSIGCGSRCRGEREKIASRLAVVSNCCPPVPFYGVTLRKAVHQRSSMQPEKIMVTASAREPTGAALSPAAALATSPMPTGIGPSYSVG
ncbi:hypothetical protein [Dickeya undicola]|uniref:hypothetical protein n=1 Tax=Dickeya undicola TaxID=1577887 RepID=UPI003F69D276